MSDMLHIGLRSLLAYQQAMVVHAQNISNLSTPGYARRVCNFQEGIFNNGVNLADVQRVFDQTSLQQFQNSITNYSFSDANAQLQLNLQTLLDDPTNNIANYINQSLNALRNVNEDPTASRQLFLDNLTTLTQRFNAMRSQMTADLANINDSLTSITGSVNNITQSIAAINAQLAAGENNGDVPALIDQRDNLLQQLASYLDFTTTQDTNGSVNIIIGNGSRLVEGTQAFLMQTTTNAKNPEELSLVLNGLNGIVEPADDMIHGGQIGGYLSYRSSRLEPTMRDFDRLALVFADAYNKQNKLGIDLNGNLGGNIFNDINDVPSRQARVINYTTNTGSALMDVQIDDATAITASDYTLQVDAPNHYILTRNSDKTVVASATVASFPATISADGFTINVQSGPLTAGDKFTILPTGRAAETIAVTITNPNELALAWPVMVRSNEQNVGTGIATVTSITDTTNAAFSTPHALSPPMQIHFLSATSYEIIDTNSNTVLEGPITYDPNTNNEVFPTAGGIDPGYRVSLTGAATTDDKFDIQFNTEGVGDRRNGQAFEDMYTQQLVNNKSLTFVQTSNFINNTIAMSTNQAVISLDSTKILYTAAKTQVESISGVNEQEEEVNIATYNEAFIASAKILEVANNVFDTIASLIAGR